MAKTRKTIAQILSLCDEIYPNNISNDLKMETLKQVIHEIRPLTYSTGFSGSTIGSTYTILTVSGQKNYPLPEGVDLTDLRKVMISNTTGNYTSTCNGTSYSFRSLKDSKEKYDNYYFEPDEVDKFSIYPTPTTDTQNRVILLRYLTGAINYSTNTTTLLILDPEYEELLRVKMLNKYAKYGDFPDVTMANNWENDSFETEKRIKLRNRQKVQKQQGLRLSYRDWEW